MNEYYIGQKIKNLRKKMGLRQSELAEGICSQSQVSKFEKGEGIPSSIILYRLSQRLGAPMEYFFEENLEEYIQPVKKLIRYYTDETNYKMVFDIISKEKKTEMYKEDLDYQQFLLWHEGICRQHIFSDFKKSQDLLNGALELSDLAKPSSSNRRSEILNSLAIIHAHNGDLDKAITFHNKAISEWKKLDYVHDPTIYQKLLFNQSKSLGDAREYKKSLEKAERGLNVCLQNNSLYLFAELWYEKAEVLMFLGEKEQALEAFQRSESFFRLQSNTAYADVVREDIEEYFGNQ
ncbi:helix-turn-helix domain-containing protein [Priestia filamentosa]|uniref:helix-turn-helix domain-containing protein n=1 Tax=Priestia filamentosa TaxID=1402861 RepID=UPI0002E25275|nr:helix-turn-helix domain-containing protein [Priestia filamentosa]RJS65415.1 transcriptional regulator [Priestia filamentosa]WCM16377.1 helix-turn-helix domain-containing protein [Priestia filamentosa]